MVESLNYFRMESTKANDIKNKPTKGGGDREYRDKGKQVAAKGRDSKKEKAVNLLIGVTRIMRGRRQSKPVMVTFFAKILVIITRIVLLWANNQLIAIEWKQAQIDVQVSA